MRRNRLAVAIAILIAVTVVPIAASATATAAALDGTDANPAPVAPADSDPGNTSNTPDIVEIAPNPYVDDDAGEFVAIEVPRPTNVTGWTLADDEGRVARLPPETLDGVVILTVEPGSIPRTQNRTVRSLDGRLALANGGDEIQLRRPNGSVVATVRYESAPEGARYRRVGDSWRWRPAGATALEPIVTNPESARAFVLPDAPGVVEDELRAADDRIYLAGYTLTSDRVVRALLDAQRRGVEVHVLLEGSPVGGVSQREDDALDRLSSAGVRVSVRSGERDPYRFHHAKYAVIDDRALVLTENFKPAGSGGHSSRGWGVVLDDPELATALIELFHADSRGPGAIPWEAHRSTVDPVQDYASQESFPTHFAPESVSVERARLLVAPDNARPELVDLFRSANSSIRIQQMAIEGVDDPLLQASIAAARNGTEVEILLSSASYVREENRRLVEDLDRLAARDDLPISARIVEPRGRFEKVHAKVAIVDDEHVVLGSLNWNPTAYGENREVVVVLTGAEVSAYYAAVFESDAQSRNLWRVPAGLVSVVSAVWLALGLLAVARIRWARS